jgi:hypothetical protein
MQLAYEGYAVQSTRQTRPRGYHVSVIQIFHRNHSATTQHLSAEMVSVYAASSLSRSRTALAAIRLTFARDHPSRRSSSTTSSRQPATYPTTLKGAALSDPLGPGVPVSSLGLPIHPLPLPKSTSQPTSTPMSREDFHRLHRLSALDPPAEGSIEETRLLKGLQGLIGLMEAVKAVEIPKGDYGELLGRGVGELVLDFEKSPVVEAEETAAIDVKKGRELLAYATRRVGDYYASRLPQKMG